MTSKQINHTKLKKISEEFFNKIKVTKKIYQPVVDGLIETSLRGVDSHGIRLLPHYIHAAMVGRINPNPKLNLKKTSPTTAVLDADNTYGITASVTAMQEAIKMAKKNGVGVVVVKNSSHFGAAAIYGMLAAKQNMIGWCFTNVDSLAVPYGGKKSFLGTNAYCFCAPMAGEDPFCLDMATTTISWNKLMMYRKTKQALEPEWAVDKNGLYTRNPKEAIALTHFGNYKGYGLALTVEILCSLLSGMAYGPHIKRMYPLDKNKRYLGHFFMAIDISKFLSVNIFKNKLTEMINQIRLIEPAQNFSEVMAAGDPEKNFYKQRIKEGIPLSEEVVNDYNALAKELGVNITL